MVVNSQEPTLSLVILTCVCLYTLSDEDVNDIITFNGKNQWKVLMYTKSKMKGNVDCRCKTVPVANYVMKLSLINIKSTEGSNVQKVNN